MSGVNTGSGGGLSPVFQQATVRISADLDLGLGALSETTRDKPELMLNISVSTGSGDNLVPSGNKP